MADDGFSGAVNPLAPPSNDPPTSSPPQEEPPQQEPLTSEETQPEGEVVEQ